jgi:hypothetical protein
MRKLAGYTTTDGMYLNARTTVLALKKKPYFTSSLSILPQVTEFLLNDEGVIDSTG